MRYSGIGMKWKLLKQYKTSIDYLQFMKTIKIAGVPEHFNLPWQMCINKGEFEAIGIDLQWTDIPEGTGKMCEML